MEQPPHPMLLGDDEGAYYRGEHPKAPGHCRGGRFMTAFWVLAPIMVLAALAMLFVRKAVHAALLLAVVMISLAVLYLVLEAPFLFAVQIIVYTGAILMLFLFVMMIVGVDATDSVVETIRGQRVLAIIGGLLLGVVLVVGLSQITLGSTVGLEEANSGGNIQGLANILFSRYVFAFEVTSALLITAAVGAMVLTHRERLGPKPTQTEQARRRVREYAEQGAHLGPAAHARRLRPVQLGRHPRPAPRRLGRRDVDLSGARRPRHGAIRPGAGRRHRGDPASAGSGPR